MTLTDREVGELQERLKQLEHRVRNDRHVLSLLEGEIDVLENKLTELKVQVYTTIGAIVTFSAVAAWVINLVMEQT